MRTMSRKKLPTRSCCFHGNSATFFFFLVPNILPNNCQTIQLYCTVHNNTVCSQFYAALIGVRIFFSMAGKRLRGISAHSPRWWNNLIRVFHLIFPLSVSQCHHLCWSSFIIFNPPLCSVVTKVFTIINILVYLYTTFKSINGENISKIFTQRRGPKLIYRTVLDNVDIFGLVFKYQENAFFHVVVPFVDI